MLDWITQIEGIVRYHLPSDATSFFWAAAGVAVAGLILAMFGARLIRSLVVAAFLAGGALAASDAAGRFGIPAMAAIIVGAVVGAILGYLMFRLWLAALTGAVAAAVVAGVLIGPSLPGMLQEFEDARLSGGASGGGFALPTPAQQQAARDQTLWGYLRAFGEHVVARYPGDTRKGAALLAVAFLVGAAMGLLAHRWTLVLGTVTVGTALILLGVVPLLRQYWPAAIERCEGHPRETAVGLGVWFLLAVAAQRRRLRPVLVVAPPPVPPPIQSSK